MVTIRFYTLCLALLAALVAPSAPRAAAADPQPVDEKTLIDVLKSADAAKADKAITCKRLAVFGSEAAVPALTPLLTDAELASWARIALEAIPGPEADAALRDTIPKLEGRLLVGVINSIGVRRDAAAADALAACLKSSDAQVASAAAHSLGQIGNAPARKTLEAALDVADPAVRSAVAEGCVLAAERLLADGNAAESARLYDAVRKAEVPKQRVLEATRGAILARGDEGIPLLLEQLRSNDKKLLYIGLSVARELPGRKVTEALVAEIETAAPQRKPLLILALADRGDKAALPSMLKALAAGSPKARVVALGVIRQLGDVSCLPALLDAAVADDADLAQAAKDALEGLPGEDVDAALAARLADARGKLRAVLIELVGRRRIEAATAALLKAADDPDQQVRHAALAALGSVVKLTNLGVLIERVVAPRNAADAEVAQKALREAAVRMPDGDACAATLIAASAKAPLPAKLAILETLGAMGNSKALEGVAAAAKSDSAELQDAASRLLGEWMTIDAAPVLLDLAKSDSKYRIRALRGYIRLARQFDMPEEQRAAVCRNALEAADRTAEKKLVLEVLARYPSVAMLRLAVAAAKDPALKNDATATATLIAQKIAGSADVQKLMAQIGQKPMQIEIVKAEYGAGTKWKDVTAVLKRHVHGFPLIALPSAQYNSAFGGDPAPGVVKQLKIQYRIDGKAGEVSLPENATIVLPAPK